MKGQTWSEDKVNKRLQSMMTSAFNAIWKKMIGYQLKSVKIGSSDSNRSQPISADFNLKKAAFEVAIERIISNSFVD